MTESKFGIEPEGFQIPALNFVLEERTVQDDKWGEKNHTMPIWLTILIEEVGEIAKAILENKRSEAFKETVQVCAVALAMLECYLRHDASDDWWFGRL